VTQALNVYKALVLNLMETTQIQKRIAAVEEIIAKAAGVTVEKMRSHERDRAYAEARMAVWFIAHDHMGFSYAAIARMYSRDHTTVIHGVGKIRKSKVGSKVLEGIRIVCPEVLERKAPGEAKMVENWKF